MRDPAYVAYVTVFVVWKWGNRAHNHTWQVTRRTSEKERERRGKRAKADPPAFRWGPSRGGDLPLSYSRYTHAQWASLIGTRSPWLESRRLPFCTGDTADFYRWTSVFARMPSSNAAFVPSRRTHPASELNPARKRPEIQIGLIQV